MDAAAVARAIAQTILGLVIGAAGVAGVVLEMNKSAPHSGHVYAFMGVAILGALIMWPSVVGNAIGTLAGAAVTAKDAGLRLTRRPVEQLEEGE